MRNPLLSNFYNCYEIIYFRYWSVHHLSINYLLIYCTTDTEFQELISIIRETHVKERRKEREGNWSDKTMWKGARSVRRIRRAILKSQSIFFKLSASHDDTANESRGTIHPSKWPQRRQSNASPHPEYSIEIYVYACSMREHSRRLSASILIGSSLSKPHRSFLLPPHLSLFRTSFVLPSLLY